MNGGDEVELLYLNAVLYCTVTIQQLYLVGPFSRPFRFSRKTFRLETVLKSR